MSAAQASGVSQPASISATPSVELEGVDEDVAKRVVREGTGIDHSAGPDALDGRDDALDPRLALERPGDLHPATLTRRRAADRAPRARGRHGTVRRGARI